MRRSRRVSGVALILFAVFYLAGVLLVSPVTGLQDADDPVTSLEFIGDHPDLFFLSGLASVLAGTALVLAVLSIGDTVLPPPSLGARVTTVFGLFAGAFLFASGIVRMQAPGTLEYIAGMNIEWGRAAYLAVQMIGTQGLASAGIFATSAWAIGLSIVGWSRAGYSHILSWLGIIPALPWIMGIAGRLDFVPEGLYILYIGGILLGIPLWSIIVGLFLLRRLAALTGSTEQVVEAN